MLRHELVELFLVTGVTQPFEEILKFPLLFLQAPQRLHAVFVEGAVGARGRAEAREAAKRKAAALHTIAHPLHLVLHPLHLILPAILMAPATHVRAPQREKEKGKSDRPPEQEAEESGH